MKLLRNVGELGSLKGPAAVAIGVFDGLHLGHQSVIRQAAQWAAAENGSSIVLTFDRHPNEIVAPNRVPPAIYPLEKKSQVLEETGVDAALLLQFDQAFSQKTAEAFIQEIVTASRNLRRIFVGSDFVFGHKRSGNLASLQAMGIQHGFSAAGVEPVLFDNTPVSSTRIRTAIRIGDLDLADALLGRPYTLCGKIIEGDRIGRTIGFPTANLDASKLALPPFGVYAVRAEIEKMVHSGVLNIGIRPTLNTVQPDIRVEVHLLDFSGDLYGKQAELFFIQRLRGEQRFGSLKELQTQIAADIAAARSLKLNKPPA